MTSELKPCPFCGGRVELWREEDDKIPIAQCWDCSARLVECDLNEVISASQAWNTRPIESALERERDEARAERDKIFQSALDDCARFVEQRDKAQAEVARLTKLLDAAQAEAKGE